MKDPLFLEEQYSFLQSAHIAPITDLIDEIRTDERWLPYVAPLHGGTSSRMLSILRDPGPAAARERGSGMLSVENNDQTAETQFKLMEQSGIKANEFIPWNAYPWYINRAPKIQEMREATPVLIRLLDLLPDLEVILLQGRHAQKSWKIACQQYPSLLGRNFQILETYHPSNSALFTRDPQVRLMRVDHRIDTWKQAGVRLHG